MAKFQMIKPYTEKIYTNSLIKSAKNFYETLKGGTYSGNHFVLKDLENNKLYKFEIKHKSLRGGDNNNNNNIFGCKYCNKKKNKNDESSSDGDEKKKM